MTNQQDRVAAPKRSDLSRKHDEIKQLRERPMTNVCRLSFPDAINGVAAVYMRAVTIPHM